MQLVYFLKIQSTQVWSPVLGLEHPLSSYLDKGEIFLSHSWPCFEQEVGLGISWGPFQPEFISNSMILCLFWEKLNSAWLYMGESLASHIPCYSTLCRSLYLLKSTQLWVSSGLLGWQSTPVWKSAWLGLAKWRSLLGSRINKSN